MFLVQNGFAPHVEETRLTPPEPAAEPVEDAASPELDAWQASFSSSADAAKALQELHVQDPPATRRLAQAIISLPEAGSRFMNFDLVTELGRGAFGRVFLAEQTELAQRRVVLKISSNLAGEARTLAQLLHTNVVPIYSIHHHNGYQAVCMPFLGATTIADVLKTIQENGSLPASGKMLVSTLHNRQSTLAHSDLSKASSKSSGSWAGGADIPVCLASPRQTGLSDPLTDADGAVGSRVLLEKLEGYSYVEAALWIASRLADGLAHAHERGILHRDLKPANILLTDEGQPMLLDFNLAEDTKLRDTAPGAQLGGTLPYMAPEQLEALQKNQTPLDARCDLYSLGIILYELLCGRFPFPHRRGITKKIIGPMLADRRSGPPSLRRHHPAVSPAVEAIVHKCMAADPARRYASARDLQEDIERQLCHQPLRHAPNPSLLERTRKWVTRHPRLTSTTTVGIAGALLLAAAGAASYGLAVRNERLEAVEQLHRFQDEVHAAQFFFNGLTSEGIAAEEGARACAKALAKYQVLDDEQWRDHSKVRSLPAAERERLSRDVALLLSFSARANLLRMPAPHSPNEASSLVSEAARLNALARSCFADDDIPLALLAQQAEIAARQGEAAEAARLRGQLRGRQPRSALDVFLTARELVVKGRYAQALPLLQKLSREEPQNVHAWFLLGRCHDGLAQDDQSVQSYTAAAALWPGTPQVYFNRGLAYFRMQQYQQALADFQKVLDLEPGHGEALVQRALTKQGLRDLAAAEADLTAALDKNVSRCRVYHLRARVREEAENFVGAGQDLLEGKKLDPVNDVGYTTRGFALMGSNPQAALADFDRALKLNHRYLPAMSNKAHVLGEILKRTQDAVTVLDQILEYYPDHVPSRVSRGVLRARLGQHDKAVEDAGEALRRRNNAVTQYQAAGIYALAGPDRPEDLRKALDLLRQALRAGFGHDWIERDSDLDRIRHTAEFRRLAAAAATLQTQPSVP